LSKDNFINTVKQKCTVCTVHVSISFVDMKMYVHTVDTKRFKSLYYSGSIVTEKKQK
jgi:hypothetical protein